MSVTLGSAIGSGIINEFNIRDSENANIPVIVDAGVGTASDACINNGLRWCLMNIVCEC